MALYRRTMLLGLSLLLLLPALSLAGEGHLINAVLIKVAGRRITQTDLNEMAQYLLRRRYGHVDLRTIRMDPSEMEELSAAARRELVRMHLILDEAESMQLSVPDREVLEFFERAQLDLARLPALARKQAEAELLIDQILKARGVLGSLITPAEMRRIYQEQKDTVFTTDSQVKIRHILLPTGALTSEQNVLTRARSVRKQVMNLPAHQRAEFFADRARVLSDDAFASQGGLLRISRDPEGWFRQDWGNKRADGGEAFPKPLYTAIVRFGPEHRLTVTDPIRSHQGIHLLFLEDIKVGKTMSWKEAQPLIRRYVERRRKREEVEKWLEDKVKRTRIVWNDGTPYPVEEIFAAKKDDGDSR